jgi:DNA excision repair protein ERCC-5
VSRYRPLTLHLSTLVSRYRSIPDPDLREHQRSMALAAVGRRDVSKGLAPLTTRLRSNALSSSANPPIKSKPLFIDNGDDGDDTDFDPELEIALQQSLEVQEAQQMQTALEESRFQEEDRKRQFRNVSSAQAAGSTYVTLMSRVSGPAAKLAAVRSSIMNVPESPDGSYLASSSIGPRNSQPMSPHTNRASESPNAPISMRPKPLSSPISSSPLNRRPANQAPRLSTSNLEQSSVPASSTIHSVSQNTFAPKLPNPQNPGDDDDSYTLGPSHVTPSNESRERPLTPISVSLPRPDHTTITSTPSEDDDDDLYIPSVTQREVPLIETRLQSSLQPLGQRTTEVLAPRTLSTSSPIVLGDSEPEMEEFQPPFTPNANALPLAGSKVPPILGREEDEVITAKIGAIGRDRDLLIQPSPSLQPRERDHGSPPRTSTSNVQFETEHIAPDIQTQNPPQDDEEPLLEEWDAAQEMDPEAEEGEFVQFMSQIRGRDVDAMRNEIDEELKTLHKQKKAAMRDSEDITQQMISQIQVSCVSDPLRIARSNWGPTFT